MSVHPGDDAPARRDTPARRGDTATDSAAGTTDLRTPPGALTVPSPRSAPDVSLPSTAARPTPATPRRARRPRLGWREVVLAAVTYVGLLVVGHAVADAAGVTGGPGIALVSAGAALGAVVAALAVRVRSTAPLCLRPASPATLLGGVALGLAAWLLARGLAGLWSDLGGTLPPAQPGLWSFTGTAATIVTVVLVGLVVPLVEELLFRGVVVAALGRHGIVVAATGSAVLFAAAHGLTFVVFAALVLGAANAVMLWRLRTVWPGVVSHATFNVVSIVLTLTLS